MRRAIFVGGMVLLSGVAVAGVFGGGGGGAGAVVDVLAELVGKNVNANSYTATTTTGPAFVATGDRVDAIRLGSGSRATIGTNATGDVFIGPNDFGYGTTVTVWGSITTQSMQVRDNIDILGNAAILNNNGPVRIVDMDGLAINGGTPLKGIVRTSATLDFPSISNNKCITMDATVSEAQVGDFAMAEASFDLPEDVTVRASHSVTVAGTVTIKACNHSSILAEDPASGPYLIRLER